MLTASEILKALPPAKRQAAVRNALPEIINLLDSVYSAVGFPKEEGWNSFVCYDLDAVRKAFIALQNPPGSKEVVDQGDRAQAHITNVA